MLDPSQQISDEEREETDSSMKIVAVGLLAIAAVWGSGVIVVLLSLIGAGKRRFKKNR